MEKRELKEKDFSLEKLAENTQNNELLKEQNLSSRMIEKNLIRTPLGEKMSWMTRFILGTTIVVIFFLMLVSFSGKSLTYAVKNPMDIVMRIVK